MTLPDSYTNDLLIGLAQTLDTAGVGVYRADGSAYQPDEVGIGIGGMPEDCDRAIGIIDYLTPDDDPGQALGIIAVQIMTRGVRNDLMDANELRDAVFQTLQSHSGVQFGGCGVDDCLRRSSMVMGQDGNGRWSHAQNFYLNVTLPPTAYRS